MPFHLAQENHSSLGCMKRHTSYYDQTQDLLQARSYPLLKFLVSQYYYKESLFSANVDLDYQYSVLQVIFHALDNNQDDQIF